MRNKKPLYTVSALLLLLCVQCKKYGPCRDYGPPNAVFFQILFNGTPLPDSTLENVTITFDRNGTSEEVKDLGFATDDYANRGILTSRNIALFESQQFFIRYPGSLAADTLWVRSSLPSKNACGFSLQEVDFDGQPVVADTTFGYQPVYVFHKK